MITAAAVGMTAIGKGASAIYSKAASEVASIGSDFGKLGTLIENPGIKIQSITKHALDKMSERGVTEDMVNIWVSTGKALEQAGDRIVYIAKEGVAVVSKAGELITTYSSEYFDDTMKYVVEQLFGK